MTYGILGIPGHVENANARPQFDDMRGQFAAIHTGHDDVGKQQVDRALVAIYDLQSGGAVVGFENLVALRFQIMAGEAADVDFIFDQKDGLLPRSARGRPGKSGRAAASSRCH